MILMPRPNRISSASGVVGALAASAINEARTSPALSTVNTSSIAAGISTSHSQASTAVGSISSASAKPFTLRCWRTHSASAWTSRPSARATPPI